MTLKTDMSSLLEMTQSRVREFASEEHRLESVTTGFTWKITSHYRSEYAVLVFCEIFNICLYKILLHFSCCLSVSGHLSIFLVSPVRPLFIRLVFFSVFLRFIFRITRWLFIVRSEDTGLGIYIHNYKVSMAISSVFGPWRDFIAALADSPSASRSTLLDISKHIQAQTRSLYIVGRCA